MSVLEQRRGPRAAIVRPSERRPPQSRAHTILRNTAYRLQPGCVCVRLLRPKLAGPGRCGRRMAVARRRVGHSRRHAISTTCMYELQLHAMHACSLDRIESVVWGTAMHDGYACMHVCGMRMHINAHACIASHVIRLGAFTWVKLACMHACMNFYSTFQFNTFYVLFLLLLLSQFSERRFHQFSRE